MAITRPKKLLLIYDDDNTLRVPIQKQWAKMGVVDHISSTMATDFEAIPSDISKLLRIGADVIESDNLADPEKIAMQWRI